MMRPSLLVSLAVWAVAMASAVGHPFAAGQQSAATPSAASASDAQRALVNKYCVTCHNQRAKTGGLTLDSIDLANPPAGVETWEKVIRKVRGGLMPPPGA